MDPVFYPDSRPVGGGKIDLAGREETQLKAKIGVIVKIGGG